VALAPGTRLGSYEVIALIGAGGMGEVYRARDTRLDRTVALKILPQSLAPDSHFRERFDREARAISHLDHPHICTLYDVGEHEGTTFLVMQYLEGETLETRLNKGALPLDLALQFAIQIAGALDTAHRAGIVHRDLKPANVMLTKSGAMLLDFGLAKSTRVEADPGISTVTTTSPSLTAAGTILGTFQYMAPEQLEGRAADTRTDIFAFGAVVYEMITGRKAFVGASQASLISAIMGDEPPSIATLRPLAPALLEHVVTRCLGKKPEDRWQTAHDVMKELQWIAAGGAQVTAPPPIGALAGRTRWLWIAAGVVVGLLVASVAMLIYPQVPQDQETMRFAIETPELAARSMIAVSPNGRYLVFSARTSPLAATYSLYLRSMDVIKPQLIPETEGGTSPFWSPDSRHIGFFAGGKVKRLDVSGGAPQTVCAAPSPVGGAWNRDDIIVFGSQSGPLKRVSASGGEPRDLTSLNGSEKIHGFPVFLPNGRQFLYEAAEGVPVPSVSLIVGSLDSKQRIVVLQAASNVLYAAPGYLLFRRDRTLFAQRFNAERLALDGEPTPIAEDLGGNPVLGSFMAGTFGVSATGVLAYQTGLGGEQSQLAWYTRAGARLGSVGDPGDYHGIALSPDDKRVAVHLHEPPMGGDIWVLNIDRGYTARLTTDPSHHITPVWKHDGSAVAYASESDNASGIYQQSADSADTAHQLLRSDLAYPEDYSPNGRYLSYFQGGPRGPIINLLPLTDAGKPQPFTNKTGFQEALSKFSPDGHWIAYMSDESKRDEVYVQKYPERSKKYSISTNGGQYPRWSRNRKELFYMTDDGRIMVVDVQEDATKFDASAPRMLFKTAAALTGHVGLHYEYDVTGDGQRFLVNERLTPVNQVAPLTVVLNWSVLLKK
jgi:Tol biopolymer transport system component